MSYSFAVDKSLGSLAKWLRILGFDTVYEADVSTGEFFHQLDEGRILITRTGSILKAFFNRQHVFIEFNSLQDQLKQVVSQLDIQPKDIYPFSRCIHCNLLAEPVPREDVFGLVPDYIWETHDKFNTCRRCNRIYWSGSHKERSMDRIEQLFESA
jgi:uncharacterized protein with PIN domain